MGYRFRIINNLQMYTHINVHVCLSLCFIFLCLCMHVYFCLSFSSQVDTYGTQQPIALLKLLLEKGGMYDRGKDLNWKSFKDIGFIAAMGKVRK